MRKSILFLFYLTLLALFSSCIKQYEPKIETNDAVKFVVTGQVNQGDSIQFVNISTTSPLSDPKLIPVSGCNVAISNSIGNIYSAKDMKDGNYQVIIPTSELKAGASFKVDIVLPDGTKVASDYDTIYECPKIDSFYYKVENIPNINHLLTKSGIRFYVDLDADKLKSPYFRWEVIETWEYQAVYPIEWWYDGKVNHVFPPDYSRKICWKTRVVNEVFTLSTKYQVKNKYENLPLHYIDNYSTPRLVYGVSTLLRQYSISESAFIYWENLRINSFEQGGLYGKQPLVIVGNLHNISNPEKTILGFFGASSVYSKRLFAKNVLGVVNNYEKGCSVEGEKPRLSFKGISPLAYPVYLYATQSGYLILILEPYCYDCRYNGGDTIKPHFWPY